MSDKKLKTLTAMYKIACQQNDELAERYSKSIDETDLIRGSIMQYVADRLTALAGRPIYCRTPYGDDSRLWVDSCGCYSGNVPLFPHHDNRYLQLEISDVAPNVNTKADLVTFINIQDLKDLAELNFDRVLAFMQLNNDVMYGGVIPYFSELTDDMKFYHHFYNGWKQYLTGIEFPEDQEPVGQIPEPLKKMLEKFGGK